MKHTKFNEMKGNKPCTCYAIKNCNYQNLHYLQNIFMYLNQNGPVHKRSAKVHLGPNCKVICLFKSSAMFLLMQHVLYTDRTVCLRTSMATDQIQLIWYFRHLQTPAIAPVAI